MRVSRNIRTSANEVCPLISYADLYDFFMHGDVKTLERANGVRAGEVWFVLNGKAPRPKKV